MLYTPQVLQDFFHQQYQYHDQSPIHPISFEYSRIPSEDRCLEHLLRVQIPPKISPSSHNHHTNMSNKNTKTRSELLIVFFWGGVYIGRRSSYHPLTPCSCTYFTHARTCDNVRVQSATQWTASVHTLHMPKPVITFVLRVLRNGLLPYILYTCPNLW